MNKLFAFLLALFVSVSASAVRLSDLSGAYSLADSAYGLSLNGTTDDGAAAVAALATIGAGKTIVIPAGKTLLTCRPLVLPAGTTLIMHGATIKRCAQPSGITTDTDIINGANDITVTDAAAFSVGEVVALRGATYKTYAATITNKVGNVLSLSASNNYLAGNDTPYGSTITENGLAVYRVGYVLEIVGANTSVLGGTIDGNKSNFAAGCWWTWCSAIEVRASFARIEGVTFQDIPGEAIQEGSPSNSMLTSTSILSNFTTTALVAASSWTAAGFVVGDLVTIANNTAPNTYNDGVRRVVSFTTTTVANDTLNVAAAEPFHIPSGSTTPATSLSVYRINEGNRYLNNNFRNIAGNAVHFSAHFGSVFKGNSIFAANLDSGVGHQYGYVTFSCYTNDTHIVENVMDGGAKTAVGIQGCNNDSIFIANNTIRMGDGAATKYLIDIQVNPDTMSKRIVLTGNRFEVSKPGGQGGGGVRVYSTTAVSVPSATQADYIGPSRVQISNNTFKYCGVLLRNSVRVLVTGNIFDMVADNGDAPVYLYASYGSQISNNIFSAGYAGILMSSNANVGLSITGNTFAGQIQSGIIFTGTTQDALISGNTFQAENVSRTASGYVGIDGVPRKAQIVGNHFALDKGTACIKSYTGTVDYSAAGQGTVVTGNICRRSGGSALTSSIVVPVNNTGLIVTSNYVWSAISDSGTSTVTTPANVVIP